MRKHIRIRVSVENGRVSIENVRVYFKGGSTLLQQSLYGPQRSPAGGTLLWESTVLRINLSLPKLSFHPVNGSN